MALYNEHREHHNGTKDSEDNHKRTHKHSVKSLRISSFINTNGLNEINLSHRGLDTLPQELFQFTRAEVIRISKNQLCEISKVIACMRQLKIFEVDENHLVTLPETIVNCVKLIELHASKNALNCLPPNLSMLHSLRVLRLGNNEFESLTHEIGMLENLRVLDLQGNKIWYLPFSVENLQRLQHLNLSNNLFEHLPMPVCRIRSLVALKLQGNYLLSLAPDFENLHNLQELNLSENKLKTLPMSICALKELRYINLANNELESLPQQMANLSKLQVLHIQQNYLEVMPCDFNNLQYLNVSYNNLRNFTVGSMKKLKYLNMNRNLLENMPIAVYNLLPLEHLKLNGNRISYVSQDIVFLRKLQTLDLGNNQLMSLPQCINELTNLDYFNVKGNKFMARDVGMVLNEVRHRKAKTSKQLSKLSKSKMVNKFHFLRKRKPEGETTHQNTIPSNHDIASNSKHGSQRHSETDKRKTSKHRTKTGMWNQQELLQDGFSPKSVMETNNSVLLPHYHRHHQHTQNNITSQHFPKTPKPHVRGRPRRHISEIFDNYRGQCYSDNDGNQTSIISCSSEDEDSDTDVKQAMSSSHSEVSRDYNLMGVCSQVEAMLNDHIVYPVTHHSGSESLKRTSSRRVKRSKSAHCICEMTSHGGSYRRMPHTLSDIDRFTITPKGGVFAAAEDQNVRMIVPVYAIKGPLIVAIQIEEVDAVTLAKAKLSSEIIDNVLCMGHIINISLKMEVEFNKAITVVIPAPPMRKKGTLHILTIKGDNTCVPCTNSFHLSGEYLMIQAWHLSGKVAIMTRSKCRYKACKSMEQLLQELYV